MPPHIAIVEDERALAENYRDALHRQVLGDVIVRWLLLFAVVADLPHQPLGNDRVERRADQIRLDADVDQSRHSGRRIVGVPCREHEVASERCLDRDL